MSVNQEQCEKCGKLHRPLTGYEKWCLDTSAMRAWEHFHNCDGTVKNLHD